jgi:hypothetical protein
MDWVLLAHSFVADADDLASVGPVASDGRFRGDLDSSTHNKMAEPSPP